jgi:hypothetical protein
VTKVVKTDNWITTGAVRYRLLGSTGKPTGVEFGLDYAKAPVPAHFYFADYLSVDEDSSQVMFTFGKLDKPATNKLRSKVEIYFNPVMFVKQFWASTREVHKSIQEYANKHGLSAIAKSQLLEAPKVQTFQSNNVAILLSIGECLLDFYYVSPKDLFYRTPQGEKVDAEALVRIILSVELVLSLLDQSRPIAEKLLPKYGEDNANLELK